MVRDDRSPRDPRLPAAALFDWDGTLADTLPLIYRANVVALGELGIGMSRAWFRDRYTPDWRSSYRALGVPEASWEQLGRRWNEEMSRGRPRAMPWARRSLNRLHRSGVRLGLVTASTRAVVAPNVTRLGLDGLFETAWFSDDVADTKPHPEALVRALEELGVDPADTVYVGDTTVDLEMTVAAGARFVAVGTTTPEAAFRAAGVERVWPGVAAWADDLLGVVHPGGELAGAERPGEERPGEGRPGGPGRRDR